MARAKLGDIFEISTPQGFAYAQLIHKHPQLGELLRVFEGTYSERPSSLDAAMQVVQFEVFFPLGAAVSRKILAKVGHRELSAEESKFPLFRSGVRDPATGKVSTWWIWDGDKQWRRDTLTAEERRFPLRQIWNDTLLVDRIVAGWRPELDPM